MPNRHNPSGLSEVGWRTKDKARRSGPCNCQWGLAGASQAVEDTAWTITAQWGAMNDTTSSTQDHQKQRPIGPRRPWMPIHVAEWLAETRFLTGPQKGAYFNLMIYYWERQTIPADQRLRAKIAGMSLANWMRSESACAVNFIIHADGTWSHAKLDAEIARIEKKSSKNRANILRRYYERTTDVVRTNNDRTTNVCPPTLTPTLTQERYIPVAKATAEFETFWQAYPKRDGANPKAPALKKFTAAVKSGVDPAAIVAGAASYANAEQNRVGTPYIAQAVTWLSQHRWEDYATSGHPGAITPPPGFPTQAQFDAVAARVEAENAKRREAARLAAAGGRVLAQGAGVCGQQPAGMGGDRARNGRMRQLGEVLPPAGLGTIRLTGDSQGSHQDDGDAESYP